MHYHYEIIGLDAIYLSYAAYFKLTSHESRALAKSRIGDSVQFRAELGKDGETQQIYVLNHKGIKIARLSKQGSSSWLPKLEHIEQAKITCLHKRLRDDGNGDNRSANRSWLIPIIEVLWKSS